MAPTLPSSLRDLQSRIMDSINGNGGNLTPNRLRHMMNIWPPLAGSGVRITRINDDWSGGRVELRLNVLNANMNGSAFGGTLFAMTDVMFGLILVQRLGVRDFQVWTRTGSFEFIRPGSRGTYLEVEITDEMVERIHRDTEGGYSTVVPYTSVVRDRDGGIVGIGQQVLYVRRRGGAKPPANPNLLDREEGANLIAAARTLARLGLRDDADRDRLVEHERVARRCIRPEARAVAWLEGVLEEGAVSLEDYRAAGLPEVVLEALTAAPEELSADARSLLDEVREARESLARY